MIYHFTWVTPFGVLTGAATLAWILDRCVPVAVRERHTPAWAHQVRLDDASWPCWGPGHLAMLEAVRLREERAGAERAAAGRAEAGKRAAA